MKPLQQHRIIVTEKGKEFIQNSKSLAKLLTSPKQYKKNSHLPPLQDQPRYSILETFNTSSDIPNIKPFKNKRAQSLYFYENNKKLMNFHLKSHKDLKQKPTIFTSISDPFDLNKKDFHQTSVNLLSTMRNKFTSTIQSHFFQNADSLPLDGTTINFTLFSPKIKPNSDKNLITDLQKSFYTKPLVKHLDEIEIIEKVQSKKMDYFSEKYKYFQDLKENIQIKRDNRIINAKTNLIKEFKRQQTIIDSDLELRENEKKRFQKRLLKYYHKKFVCKNRDNLTNKK